MADHATRSGRGLAEAVLFWLLPATLVLVAWHWQRLAWMTPSFLAYVLLVPALAMTINVAVGAGLLRMWRFNLRYAVAGVAPQIGLIYASVINLALAGLGPLLTAPGPVMSLTLVLALAAITSLLGVAYDLLAVHFGLLEVYVRAHRRGEGTWSIVHSYGFQFFGFVGLLAAVSVRAGYWMLIEGPQTPLWQAFALGIAVLVLPCVGTLTAARWRSVRRLRRKLASSASALPK